MCPTTPTTHDSTLASLIAQFAAIGIERYPSAEARLLKAARLATTKAIDWQGIGNCYWVQSGSDPSALYLVNRDGPSCTCLDFAHRRRACCHLLAVGLLKAASRLDLEYRRARDLDAPIPFQVTARGLAAIAPVAVA